LAVAAIGFGLLIQIDASTSFLILAAGLVISSLGLAPEFTLATDIVVGSAPPEQTGAASAISETTGELGGALGIAVLGSVGTAVYLTELARTIPAGISPEGQDVAQHTLAGAVDVAGRLPSEIGSLLLDAARNSFIQGLQLSIIISVAIVTFAAVLVFVGLRNVRSGSEQEEKSSLASDLVLKNRTDLAGRQIDSHP
jgi:DHA2 family multidrug resistance protein-like MFS transporter